jgi:hypothetical protein
MLIVTFGLCSPLNFVLLSFKTSSLQVSGVRSLLGDASRDLTFSISVGTGILLCYSFQGVVWKEKIYWSNLYLHDGNFKEAISVCFEFEDVQPWPVP